MPRRNLYFLLTAAAVAVLCYHQAQRSRYGQAVLEVFEQVQRRALEPVASQELFEGTMEGLLGKLDEYSSFISPEAMKEFQATLDQQFGGVGLEVGQDPKTRQLVVITPRVGQPAMEAGVRAGDRILRVDGKSTQGVPLKDAVRWMRGPPGQPVTLTVLHEGQETPVDIAIVRAIVEVESVRGDRRNADGSWNFFLEGRDRLGYVRIDSFGEKTAEELRRAVQSLLGRGMRGLVLDLRNDPGGLLEAAVAVCDDFIESGAIVSTRTRGGRVRKTYQAQAPGTFPASFPMAVLVNRYSASASEIVAACLQDHRRAVIIGDRTWGKGTVQELMQLNDLGAVKLTVASYWRPSSRNIHRFKDADENADWGVRPDDGYEVKVDGDELVDWVHWRSRRDSRRPPDADAKPFVDRPLQKAIEYLESQLDPTKSKAHT